MDEEALRAAVRDLVAAVDPKDRVAFRGEQWDRGLAMVHFPVGKGGLGLSPNDVVINGSINVRNQCLGPNGTNCIALVNFWRSLENLTITVSNPLGCQHGEFWAVSQAAPMRRVQVNGFTTLMDFCTGPSFASGGFIAPFLQPDLRWDFRVPRVSSINASGHKYGLVYPGIGWLVFRETSDLASDLVFYENYLGKTDATFTLNFSTGSAMVLAQYYNFVRFGKAGYIYREGRRASEARNAS